ncbi:oligopeptidase B [candidate division WOR-3 bacterium JGI_Cruoil_03_44_89]|uniref:Oligopeptidase B n=1 Tax=candidate division WOR-3 bacterium JGI_Cruoil_03_44_89 TaxID=1973748 RepID=A0A235BNW6_UNCW3|nr:MAG: oligopeptidase B [candidate division WOR-3 bacterium JGI_Cruoil_03_44_89]
MLQETISITSLSLILLFTLVLSGRSEGATTQSVTSPIAEVVPKVDTLFGDIRTDNYFWLRDRSNPKAIKYLEDENRYTETVMKHTEKLQEHLYKELLSRIKETDLSVPEKLDNYYYYSRTEKGKQYPIYCRKKGNLDAEEEVLLDENALAVGHKYFDIGVFRVSPNHRLVAYSVDTTGSERFTLYIKNLSTGELFKDEIPNTGYSVRWANDNRTIFYTVLDKTKRPYELYRHTLGTNPQEDILVYREKDEAFFLSISKTKSKEYLIMNLGSNTTSEVRYLKADSPTEDFRIIHPRQHEMKYYVAHHGNKFFILTNDNAKNFKLIEVSVTDPSRENWKEVIPHRDSVKIEGVEVFKNHLVLYERENGLKKIRIVDLRNNESHYVEFPEPIYTILPGRNRDFNTNLLRFNYASLVTPVSVFDYDMNKRTRELKKQYEVPGYDPSLYQSERIFARAPDGTMIPISLVYKKEVVKDGSNPLFLYGYGAYGSSVDPCFYSNRLSLLDRGFVCAIAHIRGGGEMGRYWYDEGKLLNKKNTFTDFIACAEHLIAEKYTSSDKLIIGSGSAGGLLVGAVTNMRPDLFKAVIADVPFVDVLNTMLDPSLPLTVAEYEEWGNPNDKEYYDYIKSYSPYDNVEPKDYPNMLIITGLNDTRVSYWEAAKLTAKLRALKTDKNLLLLKTNMGAGHGGVSGRYNYLRDVAFKYAFILDLFGIRR